MIHPIAPPPLSDFGQTSWWDWLFANTLLYWLVIVGVAVCLGYVAWVTYAALRARNAEASASFVSLACADRVAKSHSTGGMHYFLVYTGAGLPDVQQFEHVLPPDESSFRITYRNELHVYGFRLMKRHEGEYDAFILKSPRYDGRPADERSTFRAAIGTPRERVAFAPGMEPTDLPDAVRKAIFWAEANSRYIATGQRWGMRRPVPASYSADPQGEIALTTN